MVLISLKTSTSNAGGEGGSGVGGGRGADPGFHKRGLKKLRKGGFVCLISHKNLLKFPMKMK